MPTSTSALSFAQIAAGLPASAWAISASISSSSFARMPSGEIASFSSCLGRAYPVMKLNSRAASRHSAGPQVKNDRSV